MNELYHMKDIHMYINMYVYNEYTMKHTTLSVNQSVTPRLQKSPAVNE